MKCNSKSWAQSLIFVLIITLALPFGMMGFAETTETSFKKTAELMDGIVKLGSYSAELSEDKSSVTVEIEMEDDFTLTSVVGRFETTTSDAIVFESSAEPIKMAFEFDINEQDEFDIVVEVEATREEVVGVEHEEDFDDHFNVDSNGYIKGNIHFSFTNDYEIYIKRHQIEDDTDVESPSNNSNTDKETDKKDKPKQNDESTESVIVIVEAPTPMGSSASVETPVNVPVETEETEDLEEVTEAETPRGNPGLDKLPKTGEIPPYAYYAAGTLLLGLGVGLRKKF